MQKTVTIIQGHPDPAAHHLCHTLADAYAEGATASGHRVIRIEIAKIDFPILRTQSEFESGPLPASLEASRDAILSAEHVVIVFPLWLGMMPAIVKAFLEQVMRPGTAFTYEKNGIKKLLEGRSAHIVVTMGMPAWLYRTFYFSHGIRALQRNIFKFTGFSPVRTTMFGMVHNATSNTVSRWIDTMRRKGDTLR
ncbi:MAG: NAD(P)H-dependent oxidoreductase [Afipia sp.]|jgi:putative NADPH-quinone reductase|nr:NAD(P)H-dependent oxidoreductase [Afipia sp.]MCR6736982.1 NAD(P)H-dependent oxidoreductase [Afipia sp.]